MGNPKTNEHANVHRSGGKDMGKLAYTGIGSRQTPDDYMKYFEELGYYLARVGLTLRSGGAEGADTAFETGCIKALGKKEIFLPWPGFNGNRSLLDSPSNEAFDIASKYHPYWIGMKKTVQRLHARNSHQVLGTYLDSPSLFILCWTNPNKGGTTQALRIARDRGIPIYNYYSEVHDIEKILEPFAERLLESKI